MFSYANVNFGTIFYQQWFASFSGKYTSAEGDCYSKLIHSLLIKSLKMNHLKCDSSGSLSYEVQELTCFESKENFLLRKGFYFTEKKSSLVKAASYCSKSKYLPFVATQSYRILSDIFP